MAEEQQRVVPYTHQVSPDYTDALEPGYRFCPTDSELINYYLKRKIESGEHPRCRIYDANVYEHHPQELKERYRSCEDNWYFFTKTEPKYPTGTRVNRQTKKFGHWKSTQRKKPVYDFVTRRVVGTKRSLAFHDENKTKTPWLMQEFTYNDPNLPNGSYANKLTDWVLCKIYKKESTMSTLHDNNNNNNKMSQQVHNTRNHVEPSPVKRQRVLPVTERNQVSETNNHLGENVLSTMQPSYAFQDPAQGFAPEQLQSFYECGYFENQSNMSTSTSTNDFRFSSGGSSSSSIPPLLDHPIGDAHNTYHEDSHTLVNMQDGHNQSMDTTYDDDIYVELMSLLGDGEDV